MGIIIYISTASASTAIWKKQAAITDYLKSQKIEFEQIDMSMNHDARKVMLGKIPEEVQQKIKKPILPPQVFNDDEYCGDYDMFFDAREMEIPRTFFKLEPGSEEKQNMKSINWDNVAGKENDANAGNAQSSGQKGEETDKAILIENGDGDKKMEDGRDSSSKREEDAASGVGDVEDSKSSDTGNELNHEKHEASLEEHNSNKKEENKDDKEISNEAEKGGPGEAVTEGASDSAEVTKLEEGSERAEIANDIAPKEGTEDATASQEIEPKVMENAEEVSQEADDKND